LINKIFLNALRISILIGVFVYIFNNYSLLLSLENINYSFFGITIFLKLIGVLIIGYLNYYIFKQLYEKISFFYILKIHTVSLLGNFFSFAKSGTAYKAVSLKNTYNINYKDFSIFFVVSQILTLMVVSFVAFFYVFLYSPHKEIGYFFIILITGITIILCISRLFFYKAGKNYVLEIFFNLKKFIFLILIQSISLLNNLIFNWTLSNSIGYKLNFFDNIIYTFVSSFSVFISLTPNALGIKEFFLTNLDFIAELDPEFLLNLSISERITDVLMLLISLLIFKLGGNKIKIQNNNKYD